MEECSRISVGVAISHMGVGDQGKEGQEDPSLGSKAEEVGCFESGKADEGLRAFQIEGLVRGLERVLGGTEEGVKLAAEEGAIAQDAEHVIEKRAKLAASECQECYETVDDSGRLGPAHVQMLRSTASGDVWTDRDVIESHANFGSIRGNVAIYEGKWMYEVELHTAGIQQVGWATQECPFTFDEGVGDAPDSFAFDGKRVRKWSLRSEQYGEAWTPGDVIGCCIDLNAGKILYYRNGASLGTAFSDIKRKQPGIAYFPAVSLSHGERHTVNFGERPFVYPVSGYRPLELPPPRNLAGPAPYLFSCIDACARFLAPSDGRVNPSEPWIDSESAAIVATALGPWLGPLATHPWVVGRHVLQTLLSLQGTGQKEKDAECCVHLALRLMRVALEREEYVQVVLELMRQLAMRCRTAALNPSAPHDSGPSPYLALAHKILRDEMAMSAWMSGDSWKDDLEAFLARKTPSNKDMTRLIPTVWWYGCKEQGCSDEEMKESCETLSKILRRVEDLQTSLCRLLLERSGNNGRRGEPFEEFLNFILKKNRHATRNAPPAGLSEGSSLLSLFFVLLRFVAPHLQQPSTALSRFPARLFFSGITDELDQPRLGGAQSHLKKEYPLSEEDLNTELPVELPTAGGEVVSGQENQVQTDVPATNVMNALVMIYHLGVSLIFKRASLQLQHQVQAISQLDDTDRRIRSNREEGHSQLVAQLRDVREVFRDDVMESSRQSAWYKMVLFSRWKQEHIFKTCLYCVRLLLVAGEHDKVFAYVPEFYLDALVDSFHALRRGDPPFAPSGPLLSQGLVSIVDFLVDHFSDSRIVNPDMRDLLLQSISVLLQYKEYLFAFAASSRANEVMVPSLLRTFDSRYWIPVSNILLRLCKGHGFGQSQKPPGEGDPTGVFQDLIVQTCNQDKELFDGFMNRLLSTLNWTVSEFSVSVSDVSSNISWESTQQQHQHRKCSIMFELSVNLSRILEFFTRRMPDAFLAEPSGIALHRLFESVLYLISHASSSDSSSVFEQASGINSQALRRVSRHSALCPIAGMVCNLWTAASSSQWRYLCDLINSLGPHLSRFDYLASLEWYREGSSHPESHQSSSRGGQPQRADMLRKAIASLREGIEQRSSEVASHGSQSRASVPDELIDPLLQTPMSDPVILPSNVTVDRSTIQRHLMLDSKDPFSRQEMTMDDVRVDHRLSDRIRQFASNVSSSRRDDSHAQDEDANDE